MSTELIQNFEAVAESYAIIVRGDYPLNRREESAKHLNYLLSHFSKRIDSEDKTFLLDEMIIGGMIHRNAATRFLVAAAGSSLLNKMIAVVNKPNNTWFDPKMFQYVNAQVLSTKEVINLYENINPLYKEYLVPALLRIPTEAAQNLLHKIIRDRDVFSLSHAIKSIARWKQYEHLWNIIDLTDTKEKYEIFFHLALNKNQEGLDFLIALANTPDTKYSIRKM